MITTPDTLLGLKRIEAAGWRNELCGRLSLTLALHCPVEVIDYVNARPKPLALCIFAEDLDIAESVLDATESGDAAVNDCTIQPLMPELPFGGVGDSGMGKYHGEWGFRAYTNARGVLYRGTASDTSVRYPPYPPKPA